MSLASGVESTTTSAPLLPFAGDGCVATVKTRNPRWLAACPSSLIHVERPSPAVEEVKPQTMPWPGQWFSLSWRTVQVRKAQSACCDGFIRSRFPRVARTGNPVTRSRSPVVLIRRSLISANKTAHTANATPTNAPNNVTTAIFSFGL